MKDTREIILFFREDINFSLVDASHEILSRYKELDDPVLLPDDGKNMAPLIIFGKNPNFKLQVSRASVNFIVNYKYFDKLATIMFDMVDIFEELNSHFSKIGYISNTFIELINKKRIINKYFIQDEFDSIKDFNLSFYRIITNKYSNINCWERFITNEQVFKEILVQHDFNTIIDSDINLNMKFIKEFINTSNEFLDKRIDV